jgi:hypothetical protein
LLAGAVLAGGLGDAAHGEQDIVTADVGAQCSVAGPGLQEGADGADEEGMAGGVGVGAGGDDRVERLGHAPLGGGVIQEVPHPGAGGGGGGVPGGQLGGLVADAGEFVLVGGVDESFAGGEVAVERADADARLLGDGGRCGTAHDGKPWTMPVAECFWIEDGKVTDIHPAAGAAAVTSSGWMRSPARSAGAASVSSACTHGAVVGAPFGFEWIFFFSSGARWTVRLSQTQTTDAAR